MVPITPSTPQGGPSPPVPEKPLLLVVDSDPEDHDRLTHLIGRDYDLRFALDPRSAIDLARSRHFDCVLLDSRLQDTVHLDSLTRVVRQEAGGMVVLTTTDSNALEDTLFRLSPDDRVSHSDLSRATLQSAIRHACHDAHVRWEYAHHREETRSFAFLAIHEMRALLRHISVAAATLGESEAPPQVPRSPRIVRDRIQEAVAELEALAVGMTRYVAAELPGSRSLVPLDLALCQARRNLRARIEQRGARVSAEALPVVMGDAEALAYVFEALVDNGLKFSERPPVIEVSSGWDAQGRAVVRVADNGIGVEPRKIERLFQPFQRLHGRSVFPGYGLGLATCRRILAAHGGETWLESTPGEGTTVRLVFPAADVEECS